MVALHQAIYASLSHGRVLSAQDVDDRVRPAIVDLWFDGRMPFKMGKEWVVGAIVRHEHFGQTNIEVIVVGPGKPQFKDHYVKSYWREWRSTGPWLGRK
jgi:hypothetical protein